MYNTDKKALNKDIFDIYYKDYYKALDSVFSDWSLSEVEAEKLQKFRLNAASFAAHKTYQLQQKLKEIEADSQKNFINKAKPVVARFNQYQKTEYNTMVARSRTAKQWATFMQEKHLFPNITWIRSRSAIPRELHLGYVGITLPVNDPFWLTNQPGNLWNCKCDWKTTDAKPTAQPAKTISPAKGLEGNPYETGKLITEKHPYFNDAPNFVRKFALLAADDKLVWNKTKTEHGIIKSHILAEEEKEFDNNKKFSIQLLKNGYKEITLLPRIHKDEVELRKRYYGTDYCEKHDTKCPDAIIDNIIVEIKSSNGKRRSLTNCINNGANQSNIIIVFLQNFTPEKLLNDITLGRRIEHPNIESILIYYNGKLKKY